LPATPGRLPQRTCISCRSTSGKREFVRLVRLPEGVEVDLTGKKQGRGAYLCPNPDCWETALKKGRVEQALKTKLTPDDRLRLNEFRVGLSQATAV
jgi:predicted RNA-binding protein YlxR (DUF448 family)